MIIYADGCGGRFGNQLLRFLHWTAWARQLGGAVTVLDVPFWPYGALFNRWKRRPGCAYPHRLRDYSADLAGYLQSFMPARWRERANGSLQRVSARLARRAQSLGLDVVDLPAETKLNLEDADFVDRARNSRHLVCLGWEFACWDWLERHQAAVRQIFAPARAPMAAANAYVRDLRRQYDVLVGLFVRRTDYRTFFDGRFYYSWECYGRWAREAVQMFPGQRVGIVVTGDEFIPSEPFAGTPVSPASGSVNRGGHWFASFLELSLCDLIVGPTSTFAGCAAFLGNVPWLPLRDAGQTLDARQVMRRHLFEAAQDPLLRLSIR